MFRMLMMALALIALGKSSQAHEFYVTYVIPEGTRASVTQAFLLASSERDGHDNETSEGHLGGVDSQLVVVHTGETVPNSDIIVILGSGTLAPGLAVQDAWQLHITAISDRTRQAFFAGERGRPFADRFTQRYGQPPDDIASLAYAAARLIDLAVRDQDGTDDHAALNRAVAGY